jgi:hypothetical protein
MDNNISFSKIVATPTLNSWSQAYNAGKLFAVLSLDKIEDLPEVESLNILGKDLLEHLEQEFFVIENKNLESIKNALCVVFDKAAKGVNISFAAGVIVNNILYLFALGNSKVFIKRGDNLGLLLDHQDVDPKKILSSSGFLKEEDLIVLATDAFSQVITREDLDSSLNNNEPSEITESLAPKIHKSENGKISAIVIKYKNPMAEKPIDDTITTNDLEEIAQEEAIVEKVPLNPYKKYFSPLKSKFKNLISRIRPTKKLFLILAVIIVGVLIFSVSLAMREQNNAKIRALFAQVYPQAQKKYEEGQSLVDLNKNFARDSFLAAQKILKDNMAQFPPKSKENSQAQDLLKKVNSGLSQVSPIDKSGLDRSTLSITVQNGSGVEGVAVKASKILQDLGYNVTSTGNADNYNYEGITIKVKKENEKFLDLLKKDLAKDYTIKTGSSDLPSDSPTDALVIIGK